MGIAVDPGYPSRPFVYVCYSTASDNRVVKFTLDTSLPAGTALSSPVPLVTGIAHAQAHNGCRVRFQPGSNPPALFVTTGDGAVGTNPQNPDSDAGKVLRLTADGAPYPGNPWGATIQQAFVYAYGFRNPQGIAFRPGTNQPYISEHGPDYNDEVTALVVGGNGGWNPVPGYNQHVVMTDLGLPNVMIPKWRSGDGGTIAPSGATFLTGAQWKAWDGALAVAVLKGSHLRVMFLDDQGGISATSTVLSLGVRLRSVGRGSRREALHLDRHRRRQRPDLAGHPHLGTLNADGRPGALRRPRDALHGRAVLGRAAHDAQPLRRRGPRPGDLPPRVPRVRRLPGGHEPQGLALQDPHQHVHQHLPGEEASPRRGRPRRQRGLLPVPPAGRPRGGRRPTGHPRPRCSTRCPTRW